MAVFAAIAFATFFLENDHFVTFYEGSCDLANYFCSFDNGSTDFHGTIGFSEENAVELDCVTFFNLLSEVVDIQEFACFGFELLSLDFYDNVHWLLLIMS